jgi:dipeptidyl-peptidase-4
VYKNLGDLEIKDQISGARQALKRYAQLNSEKVAIWGWSYGGYATLRALTEVDPEGFPFFHCGTSVAPVADWRLYDTAYTERYMDLPGNNNLKYEYSSLLSTQRLKSIKSYGGKYLLVHGTMDDNVHFQQSALLESKLVNYEVAHRVQYYTDRTHSLSGLHTRVHLYKLLTEFFSSFFDTANPAT